MILLFAFANLMPFKNTALLNETNEKGFIVFLTVVKFFFSETLTQELKDHTQVHNKRRGKMFIRCREIITGCNLGLDKTFAITQFSFQ
jgi:hypothetical protein